MPNYLRAASRIQRQATEALRFMQRKNEIFHAKAKKNSTSTIMKALLAKNSSSQVKVGTCSYSVMVEGNTGSCDVSALSLIVDGPYPSILTINSDCIALTCDDGATAACAGVATLANSVGFGDPNQAVPDNTSSCVALSCLSTSNNTDPRTPILLNAFCQLLWNAGVIELRTPQWSKDKNILIGCAAVMAVCCVLFVIARVDKNKHKLFCHNRHDVVERLGRIFSARDDEQDVPLRDDDVTGKQYGGV